MLANIGKMKGYCYTETASSNVSIDGLVGHNDDVAGIMIMPLNLTAELKNLKQQTAEIDHLKIQAEKIYPLYKYYKTEYFS